MPCALPPAISGAPANCYKVNDMSRDLTDGEITEMALKNRRAREQEEADEARRRTKAIPRRRPPLAGAAGATSPKPRAPAGGAAADIKATQ